MSLLGDPLAPLPYKPNATTRRPMMASQVYGQYIPAQTKIAAPPVYRPNSPQVTQAKLAPPVYKPVPTLPRIGVPPVYRPNLPVQRVVCAAVASAQPVYCPNVQPSLNGSIHSLPTIQRLIKPPSRRYTATSDRPRWTPRIDKLLRQGHPDLKLGATFVSVGRSRSHKTPFAELQNTILEYLNGATAEKEFVDKLNGWFEDSDDQGRMQAARNKLVNAVDSDEDVTVVARAANRLLGILHNHINNLFLGFADVNEMISNNLDGNLEKKRVKGRGNKKKNEYSLTPLSRNQAENSRSRFFTTPRKSNIRVSSFQDRIPIADLSPRTKRFAQGVGKTG